MLEVVAATRVRIFSDVFCVETETGVYIKGTSGAFEVSGKGSYELASWLLREFSAIRELEPMLAQLPSHIQPHAEKLLNTFLKNGLAREFKTIETECDDDTRAQFPELCNALDMLVENPSRAWKHIRDAHVAVIGTGNGYDELISCFPKYGFMLCPLTQKIVEPLPNSKKYLKEAIQIAWNESEFITFICDGMLSSADLAHYLSQCKTLRAAAVIVRNAGVTYVILSTEVSGVSLAQSILTVIASKKKSKGMPPESPIAYAMAANHICMAAFEATASSKKSSNLNVLRIDEATLATSYHQLAFPQNAIISLTNWEPFLGDLQNYSRPNYGASLLNEAHIELTNKLAKKVNQLIDEHFGPIVSIIDLPTDVCPVPAVISSVHIPGVDELKEFIVTGLSMRECHNQSILTGLEFLLMRAVIPDVPEHERWTFGVGWNEIEAVKRALRKFTLRFSSAAKKVDETSIDFKSMHELEYLQRATPFKLNNINIFITKYGWYIAQLPDDQWISSELLGAGETAELALLDLLLRHAISMGNFRKAGMLEVEPVLLNQKSTNIQLCKPLPTQGLDVRMYCLGKMEPRHIGYEDLYIAAVQDL